ncbi:MAG TPA: twin-arginine translocase subunit TatC [Verrucomicrobiae bacterium]|jgi:sec-independent protein translocase protein TatC
MAIEPEEGRTLQEEEDEGGPVKSFLEHLEDFRWVLIKSGAAVLMGVLICLFAGNFVVGILTRPLRKAPISYPSTNQVVSVFFGTNRMGIWQLNDQQQKMIKFGTNQFVALDIAPISVTSGTNQVNVVGLTMSPDQTKAEQAKYMAINLIVLGPAHAFIVGFRVALFAGIGMASPFIFYFVGQFAFPALKLNEKKYFYRGLGFALPLFLSGVLFCYFILLPASLAASQLYANWFGFSSSMWDAEDYIGFVSKFMLGMGLGFEMPVVILVLVKIGILSYSTLVKARPYMIVINLILGAALTTPEVFTQVLMAVPLQLLFEISVLVAWYWERQEKKRAEAGPIDV